MIKMDDDAPPHYLDADRMIIDESHTVRCVVALAPPKLRKNEPRNPLWGYIWLLVMQSIVAYKNAFPMMSSTYNILSFTCHDTMRKTQELHHMGLCCIASGRGLCLEAQCDPWSWKVSYPSLAYARYEFHIETWYDRILGSLSAVNNEYQNCVSASCALSSSFMYTGNIDHPHTHTKIT